MGTLGSLLLYLGVIIAGIAVGSLRKVRAAKLNWLSKLQTVVLVLLIFMLGVEIGADDRVISSLGTIGLSALLITVCALIGSIAAIFIVRHLLGMDKYGRSKKEKDGEEAARS